jgi:hypothetical protein
MNLTPRVLSLSKIFVLWIAFSAKLALHYCDEEETTQMLAKAKQTNKKFVCANRTKLNI